MVDEIAAQNISGKEQLTDTADFDSFEVTLTGTGGCSGGGETGVVLNAACMHNTHKNRGPAANADAGVLVHTEVRHFHDSRRSWAGMMRHTPLTCRHASSTTASMSEMQLT